MNSRLTIEELYDRKTNKIVVPAGMKKFVALAYKGSFPILYVKVVGVTKYAKDINELFYTHRDIPSLEYSAIIKREPSNQYDPNAIMVLIGFKECENIPPHLFNKMFKVGYIPKELASLLTQMAVKYKIRYKARVETLTPEIKPKKVYPTCRIMLTPLVKASIEAPPAPRLRVFNVNPKMSIKDIQRELFKKGR